MKGLEGKKIGVAAERRAGAIQTLIEKQGGIPSIYSIQGKQHLDNATSIRNVAAFLEGDFEWAILTTGVGVNALADSITENEVRSAFIEKLSKVKLAVRGSKTLNWLKQNDLQPTVVSEDGTMENLLGSLAAAYSDSGSPHVFLQAYNEDDAKLKGALEEIGYSVYLSQPYFYEEPKPEAITDLKYGIIEKMLDAVVFTSKTQVRNLFEDQADKEKLVTSFNGGVLATAVGKVTANELENQGITTVIQPETQKMGAMIIEIANYYQENPIK